MIVDMIEKEIAISILEDIENNLNKENWKIETLKTINIYEKNLRIVTNQKLKKLINKQAELIKDEKNNSKKIIKINKKIDDEISRIYNN